MRLADGSQPVWPWRACSAGHRPVGSFKLGSRDAPGGGGDFRLRRSGNTDGVEQALLGGHLGLPAQQRGRQADVRAAAARIILRRVMELDGRLDPVNSRTSSASSWTVRSTGFPS